jgi:hypothetical protein
VGIEDWHGFSNAALAAAEGTRQGMPTAVACMLNGLATMDGFKPSAAGG